MSARDSREEKDGERMLNPGDRFGDYTVERLLGQGGMGAVYLLRSPAGGLVAAKILALQSF